MFDEEVGCKLLMKRMRAKTIEKSMFTSTCICSSTQQSLLTDTFVKVTLYIVSHSETSPPG